jgi:disulfide bond formation protein DsbB
MPNHGTYKREIHMPQNDQPSNANWTIIFICWLIAAISSLGSLFFSEVMEFAPCALCWYQRIFMFPLVLVFFSGLFPLDQRVVKYPLPIAMAGWIFAFYHFLVYSGFIPERLQPCGEGVSCSETYIDLFGFLTIPMLSLLSFTTIIVLLFIYKRRLV